MIGKYHDESEQAGCLPHGTTHADEVHDAQGVADRPSARDAPDPRPTQARDARVAMADANPTGGPAGHSPVECQGCGSGRTAYVLARCSDLCGVHVAGRSHHWYVPRGLGIGGGDDVQFTYCLDCGRIQGTFPIPRSPLEEGRVIVE